ncbi:MAG TPA: hypothetical protein VK783_14875 [Bacteroidia bacterium]|jgi:hypothetical protein|nr:hypothetical protein [Bacteroidia bacterium]
MKNKLVNRAGMAIIKQEWCEKLRFMGVLLAYFNGSTGFVSKTLPLLSLRWTQNAILKKSISFLTPRIYLFLNLPVAFNKN